MENWAQGDIVARKDAMPLDVQMRLFHGSRVCVRMFDPLLSMFAVRSKDPSPARKSAATHCI